jgi:hypothetical protein
MLPPDQQMRQMEADEIAKAQDPMAAMAGSSIARLKQRLPARAFQLTGDRGMLSGQQNMARELRDIRPDDPDIFNKALEAAKKYMPEKVPDIIAAEKQRRDEEAARRLEIRKIEEQERRGDIEQSRLALDYAEQLNKDLRPVNVQRSVPLGGGYVQIIRNDGSTEIRGPDNAKVAPDSVPELLEKIHQQQLEWRRAEAQAEQIEGVRGESLRKAMEQVPLLAEGQVLMGEALYDLEQGASTGYVQNRLPAMNGHTANLRRLVQNMGLNVVGMTTFGALSKGELDLSLDSSLNLDMDEDVLREQLKDRMVAQAVLLEQAKDLSAMLAGGMPMSEAVALINEQADQYIQFKRDYMYNTLNPDGTGEGTDLDDKRRRLRPDLYPEDDKESSGVGGLFPWASQRGGR